MKDRTFSDHAEFGTDQWCATTLGITQASFRSRRASLEGEGFPAVDRLIGLTNKSDVQAWIVRRRRVPDASGVAEYRHEAITGAYLDEL